MAKHLQWLLDVNIDQRGWILACVSGVACVFGSFIICLDMITKYIPWWRHFNIRENRMFMAGSLSLSYGVMIFSSLYGILPEANGYMIKGGREPKLAKFLSMVFFFVGIFVLSAVSEILHRMLPSSIVVCGHNDHAHHQERHPLRAERKAVEETEEQSSSGDEDEQDDLHHRHHHHHHHHHHHYHDHHHDHYNGTNGYLHENENDGAHYQNHIHAQEQSLKGTSCLALVTSPPAAAMEIVPNEETPLLDHNREIQRRPSLGARLTTTIADIVTGKVNYCNVDGTCFGFSETRPCDRMCNDHLPRNKSLSIGKKNSSFLDLSSPNLVPPPHTNTTLRQQIRDLESQVPESSEDSCSDEDVTQIPINRTRPTASIRSHTSGHHHVPQNEFLSIGVQTSLAIALHKIPEGFITFATNHANPKLGFAVFLALAIHNISEGFAMSLPLFLALKSRMKAILWASCLGGLSQPAGAFLAWIWLRAKGMHDHDNPDSHAPSTRDPNGFMYGALFAITAGIMCNVALQLFGQSISIYHNLKVPLVFAFLGMGVMGLSFSVSEHL